VKFVHFRKFVSRNILEKVLEICSDLEKISFSRYAFSRCDHDFIKELSQNGLDIDISKRSVGRPNLIERLI